MGKRIFDFFVFVVIICMLFTLTGCVDNDRVGNEEACQYVISDEQDFYTKCSSGCETKYVDGEGLYIYAGDSTDIPYVLICRYADMPIDAGQFLEESIYNRMIETYGDELEKIEPFQDYIIDDENLPSIRFICKDGADTVDSLCMCLQRDGDVILFNAVYKEEDSQRTLETLEIAVKNYNVGTDVPENDKSENSKTENKGKDKNLTITSS